MAEREPRARRFGPALIPTLAGWLGLAGTQVALAINHYRADQSGSAVETAVGGLTAGVLIAFIIVTAWKLPGVLRDRRIARRFPSAIVMSSGRVDALRTAITQWQGRGLPDDRVPRLPTLFTLKGATDGLSVWVSGESVLSPWVIAWDRVRSIDVGRIADRARRTNALLVSVVTTDGSELVLPFEITGAGFGGIFALKLARLDEIAARLRNLRDECTQP